MAWLIYNSNRATIEGQLSDIAQTAGIGAEAINGSIFSINSGLTLIADEIERNPNLLKNYPTDSLLKLKRLLPASSAIEVRIVNAEGTITASTDKIVGQSISEQSFFKIAKAQDTEALQVSESHFSSFYNVNVINLRKQIKTKNEFGGLVVASLSQDFFRLTLEDIIRNQQHVIYINAGPQMNPAFSFPKNDMKLISGGADNPNLELILNGGIEKGSAVGTESSDGIKRFWGASWIGPYAMRLTVGTSYEKEMELWTKETWITSIAITILYVGLMFTFIQFLNIQRNIQSQHERMASSSRLAALGEMSASMAHDV